MRYLWLIATLLLAGYLLTGVRQIGANERGVVRRFGRVLPDKPGPGLHVGLPWGMDRVDLVRVDEARQVTVGYDPAEEEFPGEEPRGQYLTGDRNLVNVRLVVHYRVDGDALEDYVEHADRTDALVSRAAEAVLAEWVAGRMVDDVLLQNRTGIRERLRRGVQERIASYRLGVRIEDASIEDRSPPSDVKGAFDDVTRAQTEARTAINGAREYAEQRRQKTRAEVEKLKNEAEVFVKDQQRKALVDRKAFEDHLAALRRQGDRPAYLRLLWWQEVGKVLLEMAKNDRIQDLNRYLGKNGLDLTYILPSRPGKK